MADKSNATIGFEKQIWDAACVLWGYIPATEYRKVIVGLILLICSPRACHTFHRLYLVRKSSTVKNMLVEFSVAYAEISTIILSFLAVIT